MVTILGGRFGTDAANVDVTFGGVKGSIKGAVTDTQITVTTPARTLKDPAVPETVNVVVTVNGSRPRHSVHLHVHPARIFISSINPTEGASAGGDVVPINGGHFGTNIATTRVTFCGRPATITAQPDQQITVSTPASPADLEVCDVVVTRDLGLVSQQSATSPQQFTYRRVLTPVIYSVSPRTGPNDASTRVTIFGTGFQFPMQVFLTGGACGAQRVEAAVSDITLTTIVFKTPVAVGRKRLPLEPARRHRDPEPDDGEDRVVPGLLQILRLPDDHGVRPRLRPVYGRYARSSSPATTSRSRRPSAAAARRGSRSPCRPSRSSRHSARSS